MLAWSTSAPMPPMAGSYPTPRMIAPLGGSTCPSGDAGNLYSRRRLIPGHRFWIGRARNRSPFSLRGSSLRAPSFQKHPTTKWGRENFNNVIPRNGAAGPRRMLIGLDTIDGRRHRYPASRGLFSAVDSRPDCANSEKKKLSEPVHHTWSVLLLLVRKRCPPAHPAGGDLALLRFDLPRRSAPRSPPYHLKRTGNRTVGRVWRRSSTAAAMPGRATPGSPRPDASNGQWLVLGCRARGLGGGPSAPCPAPSPPTRAYCLPRPIENEA